MPFNWKSVNILDIDWNQALHQYFDKPERFKALNHLKQYIPKKIVYELFGTVWIQSESHYKDNLHIKELLNYLCHNSD